jgi:O-antigen ligase
MVKFWQEKFDWLLFLLPVFFPLYLIKIDLAGVPFNLMEILLLLTLVGQIAFAGQSFLRIKKKLLVFAGLFALSGLIGTFIVPKELLLIDGSTVFEAQKIALGILKGWILLPLFYFLMLVARVKKTDQLIYSLYAYIASAFPLVIWAFWQYLSGDFITLDGRASGPFVNANYLAMYLAPAVTSLWILSVQSVISGLKIRKFLFVVILAMLYSITMLMTQSYGAMLAVIFSLLVFLFIALSKNKQYEKWEELDLLKKIGYFLGVFAFIAFISAALLYAGTEKWKLFTEFKERSSSSVRLQVYQVSKDLILENPWLGLGLGQFQAQYDLSAPRILGHEPYELIMLHPHNTFLSFWVNMGLFGAVFYLVLIILVFREVFTQRSYQLLMFKLIGFSMFLTILMHGMVDTYFFKNDLALMFWLIVAMVFLPSKLVLTGKVVDGQKLGRKIGFPTANLDLTQASPELEDLPFGVYAVSSVIGKKSYIGAMNYGPRPTVENSGAIFVEIHYLNFSGDLYGKSLVVEVEEFIRLIFKFKDLDELKANIDNDLKVIGERVKLR